MLIDDQELSKIAKLAQLNLSDDEKKTISHQMDTILEMMKALDAVDTSQIAPLSNPLDSTQRLRKDEVTEEDVSVKMQLLTNHTADGLYLVPKVLEDS